MRVRNRCHAVVNKISRRRLKLLHFGCYIMLSWRCCRRLRAVINSVVIHRRPRSVDPSTKTRKLCHHHQTPLSARAVCMGSIDSVSLISVVRISYSLNLTTNVDGFCNCCTLYTSSTCFKIMPYADATLRGICRTRSLFLV